jgi:hypothetical protein
MMSSIHVQYSPAVGFGFDHNKPILAERFKTKLCQNYVVHGNCPYEIRCMFAHGDCEMRSKEMNLAAGLVTEDAIKKFQRDRMIAARHEKKRLKLARKAAEAAAAAAAGETLIEVDPASPKGAHQAPKPLNVTSLMSPIDEGVSQHSGGSSPKEATNPSAITVPAIKSPLAIAFGGGGLSTPHTPRSPGGMSDSGLTPTRRYRHDPYSASASQTQTPLMGTSPMAADVLPHNAEPATTTTAAAAQRSRSRSPLPLTIPPQRQQVEPSAFLTPVKHYSHSQISACATGAKPVSPLAAAMMRRHHASEPEPEPAFGVACYHAGITSMLGDPSAPALVPVVVADEILMG